ncbi:MAG TPA: LysR substrate-binding domain-containing protein [Eoetvoesiella sp.]
MEIRQLRYFTRVVELGSMGKAARELGVVTSALSQQISRLEGELSTRLLQRTSTGVIATDAGIAFFRQAQLALRHVDQAVLAAQQARLSGHVSVGMAPTTASVLGLPLMQAMRQRYPDVRFHLVEALSGHLATMLNARQLDLAILFNSEAGRRWSVMPLLDERLFVIAVKGFKKFPRKKQVHLADLTEIPLVLPTGQHGLRSLLASAFGQQDLSPTLVLEIDSLAMLMDAVGAGLAATIQPGAAIARLGADAFAISEIGDATLVRRNLLVSLSDDELSPAGLATRVVIRDMAIQLVKEGRWIGASLNNE